MGDETQLCTFYVGDLFCGVDVVAVQEVLRYQEMTSVPLAHAEVTGLINLRGQIVTAIDMRKRLGLEDRAPGENPMNVIVHSADGEILSLLVDQIGDVLETDPSDAEDLPRILDASLRRLLTKAYKLEGKLLLVLDIETTVDLSPDSTVAA